MAGSLDIDVSVIGEALAVVSEPRSVSRINIGFSGGLDSTVLLHLVWRWWQGCEPHRRPQLRAIHVNHQLQRSAEHWEQHCARICQQWGVDYCLERVAVARNEASLEQAARYARLDCFQTRLGSDEILLLAHHRDDQVETLLQRLARGSGPLGLGGMSTVAQYRGMVMVRPLLDLDRAALSAYASGNGLEWVDDPTNLDETLERNFVRRQLLPPWRQVRQGLNQALARTARLSREAAGLLDQLAAIDRGQRRLDGGLSLAVLHRLPADRQRNLLRYWLKDQGVRAPSESRLQSVLDNVLTAAEDAQPRVDWGDMGVRRYGGCLFIVPTELPAALSFRHKLETLSSDLDLPVGRLQMAGGELAFSREVLQQGRLDVAFRAGGERLKLSGRPSKSLKDLFQEQGVPPWLRGLWPILYQGDQIVGLPDLWVCEEYLPRSLEDGIYFHWHHTDVGRD